MGEARAGEAQKTLVGRGRHGLRLGGVGPSGRDVSESGVGSAMHAASQLPGVGPTDVDEAAYKSLVASLKRARDHNCLIDKSKPGNRPMCNLIRFFLSFYQVTITKCHCS